MLNSHYRQIFTAMLLSFALLMLLRIALFLLYPNDFSSLTFSETVQSFFMGFRVDMSTLFVFLALPILMATFPIKAILNRRYRQFIGLLMALIMIGILFLVIGDMIYFSFVHRHIASELLILARDTDLLVDMALDMYLNVSLGSLLLAGLLIYVYIKIFSTKLESKSFGKKEYLLFFIIIITIFMGVRQSVQGRSFGIPDAFAVSKVASGNLAINGLFSAYRSSKSKRHIDNSKLDMPLVQTLFKSDKTVFSDKGFPLMRQFVDEKKAKNYNVVIILLESWSAKFVDSFGHNNFNATPNFDKLAQESLKFENFYANGQRSIEGITAMLAGITQPSDFPNIGWGLELNNLSYIGNIAKQHNYSTIAMQSSNRNSFHIDGITALAGFDDYSGAEDMAQGERESKTTQPKFGTWDGNMFRHLHQKLNAAQEPFISFGFSATTHSPFYSPGKEWEIYPHDNGSYYGYLNTLHYADAMLGEFMDAARLTPWFKNTIFIFTADHTLGFDIDEAHAKKEQTFMHEDSTLAKHHIPLLIYAPDILKPKKVNFLASQSDIFVSIVDILGFDDAFASTGNSLFDESVQRRSVYLREGNSIIFSEDNSTILMNAGKIMQSNINESDTKKFTRSLESLDTGLSHLLVKNRWAKP